MTNNNYTFWNFRESELYKELKQQLTPPLNLQTWGINDHISYIMQTGMFYETHTLLEFYNNLPKEGMILDIGANIGNHQIMFSQLWPGRRIFGFEASPFNYSYLYQNTARYQNVSNVCLCLGDKKGLSELVHFSDNMGGSGVKKVSKREKNRCYSIPSYTETLDSFNFEDKISLIKIDVEHFELQVLKGATKTLKKHKPVIWIEDFKYEKDYENSTIKYLIDKFNYKVVNENEDNYLLSVE